MKAKHINGNLLDFPNGINIIVNNCNCHNVMGAGIAAQIKQRYPQAYEVDRLHHNRCKTKGITQLGTFSRTCVKYGDDNHADKYVVNLYGQDSFGRDKRQLNYEAIYCAMESLCERLVKGSDINGHKVVLGFPYGMGCGLAGGNFSIVESMINAIFEPTEIPVFIVKFAN